MSMIKPSMINIPFYSTYADRLPKEGLPACIGFRICAIRETFEESGVLLVTLLNDGDDPGRSGDLGRKTLSHDEIKSWRGKVHSDSSFFIKLCRSICFNVYYFTNCTFISTRILPDKWHNLLATTCGLSSSLHLQVFSLKPVSPLASF